MPLSCGVSIPETGGQPLEAVDRLFVHNEQVDRSDQHFPRKLQWDVLPRAAEQRRAYRRKDFIPGEEDNSTGDKHVYNKSSDRLVEHCDHRHIPRFMLCRGMYE